MSKFVILIDGAFAIQKLKTQLERFPKSTDITALVDAIRVNHLVANSNLLRTYFYHAKPATGSIENPIGKQTIDLGRTEVYRNQIKLIQELEIADGIAVRLGETSMLGWKLGQRAIQKIGNEGLNTNVGLGAGDLVPDIKQKGVDLRIGLDIARLSLGKVVDAIVVITGDSDFIPAFKFARREGIQVYLNRLEHGIKRELKVHVDGLISCKRD